MKNLLWKINQQLLKKEFANGLASFVQANCQVSLTDNGYRIYRPYNKNPTSDGNTMWGGLKLQPYSQENRDILETGHTYIFKMHIHGVSNNAVSSIGWSNNMGWGGGGLNPSPSNVSYNAPGANFNGDFDYFYKFTVNDSVWKTCTSSYSSFVQGTSYLSYRDLMFGFGYTDTGSSGTDLYLTNFRLYDITGDIGKTEITKKGALKVRDNFIEVPEKKTQFYKDSEILAYNFYEY